MKLDAQLRVLDPVRAGEFAKQCEQRRYDAVWSVEAGRDPFLPLVSVAVATRTLEFGTNIAVAFARSPLSMAQVAWDLQRLSGGRLILGLGTQVRAHVERRYSMPFEHPAARVSDYIRCLRAIWRTFQTGEPPVYRGPFYQFTLMNPMFNPGPIEHPEIKVALAGVNPRMCEAAGEVADGFHVHPMHSPGYLRDIVMPALDKGARTRSRRAQDLELFAPVFVVTGDDPGECSRSEARVRQQIAFYGSTPSYRTLLEYHGFGALGKDLGALARSGEWEAMARRIPDALVEAVAVVAKPSELAVALRKRCEGLLDRVSLYFPIAAEASESEWRKFVDAFHGTA